MPVLLPTGHTVDACLFDLDGTLVDTLGDFDVALNHTLQDMGWPPVARAVIGQLVGRGSEHLLRAAWAHGAAAHGQTGFRAPQDLPADLLARAWALYQQHYRRVNGRHSTIYPGAAEGLAALSARQLPLACVTNKPTAFAVDLLAAKDLARWFGPVFGGDAFSRKKPDPLPLIRACEALGTAPHRTLMVGDSVNDVLAARAAGCPVVLVRYGYNHGRPAHDAGADACVDSLLELVASA
jgi:phosphoglycolate phosphatase